MKARVINTGEIVNVEKIADGRYASKDEHIFEYYELDFDISDDIRQRIINLIKMSSEFGGFALHKWEADEMLAWLEKQGEQKPTDKVEPKFKVGDWCIDNEDGVMFKIVKVLDNTYIYETTEGKEYSCTHYSLENDAKLWTIQDAKDGDVLSDGTTIFIFKDLLSDGSVMSYCDYDTDIGDSDAFCPLSVNLMCSKITPSTKEQRDILEKAITNAGYKWDAEHKELKKIEQKSTIEMKTPEESLGVNSDTYNKIMDECVYGEQNPAWSEEDEKMRDFAIMAIGLCKQYAINHQVNGYSKLPDVPNRYEELRTWLKSLKDRVQPKQEQSDIDKDSEELIDKSAVVAEINRVLNSYDPNEITSGRYALVSLRDFLDTFEVKRR